MKLQKNTNLQSNLLFMPNSLEILGDCARIETSEIDSVSNSLEDVNFCKLNLITSSFYEGEISRFDLHGKGRYTMPSGVTFVGNLKDGMFEGNGILQYSNGSLLYGIWHHGHLITISQYQYSDGLLRNFYENTFQYCTWKDRRFYTEILDGISSGKRIKMTNKDEKVPDFTDELNDIGEGYLDLSLKWILNRQTLKPLRQAREEEIILAKSSKFKRIIPESVTCPQDFSLDKTDIFLKRPILLTEDKLKLMEFERKLQIHIYKLNHNIVDREEIDQIRQTLKEIILTKDLHPSELKFQQQKDQINVSEEDYVSEELNIVKPDFTSDNYVITDISNDESCFENNRILTFEESRIDEFNLSKNLSDFTTISSGNLMISNEDVSENQFDYN